MKIVSHNINGLKAYMTSDRCRILNEGYEVYCFQEVKCSDNSGILGALGQDILNSYDVYSSINTFKKGYSGVTTLVRKDIPVLSFEIPVPCISGLSGYAEGRVVCIEFEDFYLINLYNINSGGEIKTKDRPLFEAYLIDYIKNKCGNKSFIISGDLNVCSTLYDYWGDYERSMDLCPGLMKFEVDLFQNLVKELDLVDSFRYFHTIDRKYSWYGASKRKGTREPWETGHGWRLDYFLVSSGLINKLVDSDILELYQHHDHSPIILELT
jgi:exodeoxyribonuclease-3